MERKQKIINKVYKILPIFENNSTEEFHSYLSRLIIELTGEPYNYYIEETIIALKGIYKQERINRKELRSIVLYYTNKLSKQL